MKIETGNMDKLRIIGFFSILVGLLTGCESLPNNWHNNVDKQINITLGEAVEASSLHVPGEVQKAMLPEISANIPSRQPELIKPRFDLTANKTSARDVFMSLVKDSPYSMVVHPDINGEISMHLKNVTIDEALDALQRVHGYAYRNDGNRYYILGKGVQSRIFSINYLNFNRKGHSNTRVSSAELNAAGSNGDRGSVAGTHGIQIKTDSESDFWKELQLSLQTIIGEKDDRRVVVHPQSGLVIVRALPSELRMVETFLGTTQESVNRQVILEAKIIEVELNDSYQTGINWTGLGTSDNKSILASQVGGGTSLSAGVSETAGLIGNLQPDASYSPISSAATSAFGGVFSLALKARKFSAFLEFLQGQGDVHVLSSPRVSTVNNQRAVIKVGGDEFFVTGVTSSSTSSNGGTDTESSPTVELTPFFSGIALDVTPQIDELNNIILHIHPTVSNVSQKDKTFVINGKNFSLPLAISNIQESDNVVRSETGQVIVIGGLMKEASSDDNASIPLLGDLPLIGQLFRHQKVTRVKKELVILLKPTVVNSNDTWGKSIQTSQQRTQELLDSRVRKSFFEEPKQ